HQDGHGAGLTEVVVGQPKAAAPANGGRRGDRRDHHPRGTMQHTPLFNISDLSVVLLLPGFMWSVGETLVRACIMYGFLTHEAVASRLGEDYVWGREPPGPQCAPLCCGAVGLQRK